ncbi:MAG: hypothetical protein WAO52_08600 [Prolixibacteraceae bacterium]
MKVLIAVCAVFLSVIGSLKLVGQTLSAEATGMESSWSLSGSFSARLNETSKVSFSNMTRIGASYLSNEDVNLLVMTTVGYEVSSHIKSTGGFMYTNSGGLKPSFGLQYVVSKKQFLGVLFPNLNIGRHSDLMMISMGQYLRNVSEKVKFVLRLQSLALVNSDGHLFSTIRLRCGLIRGKYQIGAASDFNFFGSEFEFVRSYGLFIQYQLM